MRFLDLLHNFGLLLPDSPNTVWLFTGADEIDSIYPIVDTALRQRPEFKLVIAVPRHDLAELRRRLPHEQILVRPLKHGCANSARYGNSALRILGSGSGHFAKVAPRGLNVDKDFDSQSILSRLPDLASTRPEMKARSRMSFLTRVMAGAPIDRIDDLARRLGQPHDIMCMGNGPSSEDPRLDSITYDCLFRVNWIWRERGLYLNPKLVVTADRELPSGPPMPIIGFPSEAAGLPVLRHHCVMLRPPRQGYLFIDSILPALRAIPGDVIPSNGAIMIALAAALKPQRIIIAGIDLYSHEQGRYPGDKNAIDGYSRDHSRIKDLEFIRLALHAFEGEIIILSEGLRKELGYGKI